ncbi:MAG: snoRNA-binding rRNA-processing protein utp10 [Phylliscum demangeonii]|nr:MAG: snoRNA-binding rRNA-processing protein utp10 [Phylliscum demangeonii]
MQALELAQQFGVDDVDEIERRTQDLVLKMILKLNDTSFRPIFAKFVEWATTGLRKKDRKGRVLRQITLYHLLEKFFATLKSLVTSYASHIIENVVYVLTRVSLDDIRSRTLWAAVLRTLRTNFEFDQDGFWQSPSHFNAIRDPLLAQLGRGTEMPTVDEVVPAIAELAAAVESGDHHKEMNTAIMKHLRSDNPHVRLAAIKCEEALTARLGEDWLALLPEMLPFVSELQEDDDEDVERETHRWIVQMEGILGENLDAMLQ